MPLAPKKINSNLPSPIILTVILCSIIYWIYLSLSTRMDIAFDAIDYQTLAERIYTQGWISYFTTGPNREPLYPLLISLSMHIGHWIGLPYTKIMAIGGMIILSLSQLWIYHILRLLKIGTRVCVVVLIYWALSPALNNSAFSLFSEIITYPFVLGVLLTSFYFWESIKDDKKYPAWGYSILSGILLAGLTLIKGIFECIAPIFILFLFFKILKSKTQNIKTLLLCLTTTAICFYIPITTYKWLNWHYNGNFVLTTRASWMVYGNTARRMEPLNLKKLAEALSFAPGEGVCNKIFGQEECAFWSFEKSDELGMQEAMALKNASVSSTQINSTLLNLSVQKASHHPLQYFLLDTIEGFKMFFWESTQLGFVKYPPWLQKIYNIKILDEALRFFMALITLISVFYVWLQVVKKQCSQLGFLMAVLIGLYILFFSFVSILTRYALPIVPLYLIAIGIWFNQILPTKK